MGSVLGLVAAHHGRRGEVLGAAGGGRYHGGRPAPDQPRPRAAPAGATRRAPAPAATSVPGRLAARAAALATGRARVEVNGPAGSRHGASGPARRRPRAAAPRPPGRSRAPTGGTGPRRSSSRLAANSGPRMSPRLTARPPAATTATACAAASVRDSRRASQRSGWAIGPDGAEVRAGADDDLDAVLGAARPARRSGGGPTPTARTRWVTSLAPIMITARSGCSASTSSTWPTSAEDCAPTTATLRSRTGRRASADRPSAIRARRGVGVGVHAVAGGRGVAEHGQHQRRRSPARHAGRRPHPVGARRVGLGRRDPAAGQLRLAVDQADHGGAERAEAAAAEGGGGHHPACP